MSSKNKIIEFHVYVTEDREVQVPIVDNEAWLTQKDMAELFNVSVQNIGQHIKNVIEDDEIDIDSTIKNFFIVAEDGKKRQVMHYNLEVIIPVGYRVNSKRANHFRKWANNIIRKYLVDGVAVNEPRLASVSDEVLAKVAASSIKSIVKEFRNRGVDDAAIRSRLNGIISRNDLTDMLDSRIKDEIIQYGKLTNQTYIGLFGRGTKQLENANGGYKVRDGMSKEGLDILSAAESTAARMIGERQYLRFFEALSIMDRVCRELRPSIIGLQRLLGIDLGTNKPLLPPGDDNIIA